MGRTLGIGEAARYLGISRSELVALYRQDLVPWVGTAELPRFDVDDLDRFRPQLKRSLTEAHRIEGLRTPRSSPTARAG